jgi:hypothetical protein
MKKRLKKFFITIGVIILLFLTLGLIFPGLIWEKKLGVTYTVEDVQASTNKIEELINLFESDEVMNLDMKLSSSELTGYLNDSLKDMNLKKIEAKINNGNVELTTKLTKDFIMNEIIGDEEIDEETAKYLKLVPNAINLYLVLAGNITDNEVNLKVDKIVLQGVKIPQTLFDLNEITEELTKGINELIEENSLLVKSLTLKENELNLVIEK